MADHIVLSILQIMQNCLFTSIFLFSSFVATGEGEGEVRSLRICQQLLLVLFKKTIAIVLNTGHCQISHYCSSFPLTFDNCHFFLIFVYSQTIKKIIYDSFKEKWFQSPPEDTCPVILCTLVWSRSSSYWRFIQEYGINQELNHKKNF